MRLRIISAAETLNANPIATSAATSLAPASRGVAHVTEVRSSESAPRADPRMAATLPNSRVLGTRDHRGERDHTAIDMHAREARHVRRHQHDKKTGRRDRDGGQATRRFRTRRVSHSTRAAGEAGGSRLLRSPGAPQAHADADE